MTPGIYTLVSGLDARWRQQEVTARNISSATMPGHKRQVEGFATFDQALRREVAALPNPVHRAPLVYPQPISCNLSGGTLKNTEQPLDVAIDGPGFFQVQTALGPRLSRNGHFTVDTQGRLVDSAGQQVIGDRGPITLSPGATRIESDGTVSVDGKPEAKLNVYLPTQPERLVSDAGSLFAFPDSQLKVADSARLVPGHLELSNVELPQEMTAMIHNQRMYDMMTRAVQTQDESLARAIQELTA